MKDLQTSPSFLKAVSQIQSVDAILAHAKVIQKSNNIDQLVAKKAVVFYNSDKVSRVVPHKNATILVKNSDGFKERVCLRILEKTVESTYNSFCNQNPECIINLRKFGELRPRNVRLRKMAKRSVCCCTVHVNID